jgi:hypothetical protein
LALIHILMAIVIISCIGCAFLMAINVIEFALQLKVTLLLVAAQSMKEAVGLVQQVLLFTLYYVLS